MNEIAIGAILFNIVGSVIPILVFGVFIYTFVQIAKHAQRMSSLQRFQETIVHYTEREFKKAINNRYDDVSLKELEEFQVSDIGSFKNKFAEYFLRFEHAYNNLDFGVMKSLTTERLFQNYYTGMKLDKDAGIKKVLDNPRICKINIYEVLSTKSKQVVSTYIEIEYIKYSIDKKGVLISGSKTDIIKEKFEVSFKKFFDMKNNNKCPNCGAVITGNVCDYCRSKVVEVDFQIDAINRIDTTRNNN